MGVERMGQVSKAFHNVKCAVKRRLLPGTAVFPIAIVATFANIAVTGHAMGQTTVASSGQEGESKLSEVVVTAQRRAQNLQTVPISVIALPATKLANLGITNSSELDIVTPGLVSFEEGGYSMPHLRGVGTVASGPSFESPIALYVDDVYYGAMSASTVMLNNIEQIEVDRGPQGTLFGRNATGGLIQIKTLDPTQDFHGKVGVGYGNYETWNANLYVTGGLTSNIAADLAAFVQDQAEGYGRNLFTGNYVNFEKDLALRSKWIFAPSSATDVTVELDYTREKFAPGWPPAPGTTPLGGPAYTGPTWGVDGYEDPHGLTNQGGVSVRVRQDLSWAQFASITAYRHSKIDVSFDGTLVTDFNFVTNLEPIDIHTQYTQEFQLSANPGAELKWVAGAYLFYADSRYDPIALTGGLIAPLAAANIYSNQYSRSGALYGQVTKEVVPGTNVTLGLRDTVEKRQVALSYVLLNPDGTLAAPTASAAGNATFNKPTWRIAVDQRLAEGVLGYVSYNRGFKSGGFNDAYPPPPAKEFQPETLDAYSIGLKTDLLSNRLRLNLEAFDYEYKNLQAIQFPTGYEVIYNAPKLRISGLDLDLEVAVNSQLQINIGAEGLHSKYVSFPDAQISTPAAGGGTIFTSGSVAGNQVALAPKATVDISAVYTIESSFGRFTGTAAYAHNAGWFAEPDNRLRQPSYSIASGSIAWRLPGESTTFRLWGKNLTNTKYVVALASQGDGDFAQFAPPRTWGGTVEYKF